MKSNYIENVLQDGGITSEEPKIVAIGGGTGLSVLLRGIKKYTSDITAIVTVSDDGGGSGIIREDMGILPPGDIRNCIVALANTEPIMEQLMQYRFKEGSLRGQCFGNLLIAAMNEICGSFDAGVKEVSSVLAVTGKVLPVTLSDVVLYAELEDGIVIKGESQIPIKQQAANKRVRRVFLEPGNCEPLPVALKEIQEADAIILGPGSLYTSIIPNILVNNMAEAIKNSAALKIYVSNIMTQQGETIGYSLSEHIRAINDHGNRLLIDYAIANTGEIPEGLLDKYKSEDASPVTIDYDIIADMGIRVLTGDFVSIKDGYLRHNFDELAGQIFRLLNEERLHPDKKKLP
ncbi:MAG TPA: gluconeogenesis factor YvcK family protein [Clostridia bacterium]|nr:gluconeogenesis factor YvcK family protein [Clostridia bacterium]